ncbi:hypothetical protein FA95DRAFT_1601413 [Auriscalpium vulgare]|uniref:Uncharacterized protein n=1 Tax=Auriscalpium vulgare TaxID=40419 RepID=A0ACB8SB00_9AGAM|nr:hypothetical protein FA95DRAFT_1601413 [Auriscalpium vulgare]
MSFVVRVELPTYSHSFLITVSNAATILDVKHEIHKACTGGPRVDGQRLIWRGRILVDGEKVQDLWKTPTDPHVLHLAVHPSSWTGAPPNTPATDPSTPAAPLQTPPMLGMPSLPHPSAPSPSAQGSFYSPYTTPPRPYPGEGSGYPFSTPTSPMYPLSPLRAQPHAPMTSPSVVPSHNLSVNIVYVGYRHQMAIAALTEGRVMPPPPAGMEIVRGHAVTLVAGMGYRWPTILDEEFPPAQDESAGLQYERTTIDGFDYLSLVRASGPPTPLQTHALKVLEQTFPLLLIPPQRIPPAALNNPISQPTTPLPINVNARLQQLGLPPLRPRPVPNPLLAELRALQLRALAAPLLLLTVRAVFLLYFFSPFQKPLFGVIVSAWLLYETWNAIRNAMPRVGARNAGGIAAARGAGNGHGQAAPVQPGQPVAQPPAPAALRGPAPHNTARQQHQGDAVLDHVANINLHEESNALDAPPGLAPPTATHRLKTFVQLLAVTVYPAVWDRRRTALRRREGRVRTEANAREASEEPVEGAGTEGGEAAAATAEQARIRARADLAAAHERRPEWVKEYIERVRRGDWVDE